LAATGGDSLWVCWAGGAWPQTLLARCLTGDSWQGVEPILDDSGVGVHWPAAVVDDSGRVMVAFFLGDYPVGDPPTDTWGIYTATRGFEGWEDPALAHDMRGVYPVDICLGISNQGTVGMAWAEDYGGINSMDSVMYSRRTSTGWTERVCLGPGRYPDKSCYRPTMVADDTTAFCLAYERWDSPDLYHIFLVAVDDTVVGTPIIPGAIAPVLARDSARKFFAYVQLGLLFVDVDYGDGWTPGPVVASGLSFSVKPSLCVDVLGYAWTCWYDSAAGLIKASYFSRRRWSEPEMVATASPWLTLSLASDGYGRVHCLWVDHDTLKHAYRLEFPAIEEEPEVVPQAPQLPFVARGVLRHPGRQTGDLLDIAGRRVMSLKPGENDIRHVVPGVYFVRRPETEDGRLRSAVRKVVVQR
jgi:hypothetical protein